MTNAQKTSHETAHQASDTFSRSFAEFINQSRQNSEEFLRQGTQATESLAGAFGGVQEDMAQMLTAMTRFVTNRSMAVMGLGMNFVPTPGPDESRESGEQEDVPGLRDTMANQWEADRSLYQDLMSRMVSLQDRQLSAARAMVAPTMAVLEAGRKQSETMAHYGEAVLEAFHQLSYGWYRTAEDAAGADQKSRKRS